MSRYLESASRYSKTFTLCIKYYVRIGGEHMKEVEWQMKEDFSFPKEIGQPESAENIKITPRFTVEEFEGRPKLTGIYHIAVDVNLADQPTEMVSVDDAILIDDLEINGQSGYFEYALPFNIDFPPEAKDPVHLKVENPNYEVDAGHLSMIWDVKCTYTEAGIEKSRAQQASDEETVLKEAEDVQEKVVEQASADDLKAESVSKHVKATGFSESGDEVIDFITQLEDGVSTTSFRLNDVFV